MELEFTESSVYEKKCGEILIENGFFLYKCEFCNKKFQDVIELFQDHYWNTHDETLESSFVKIEEVEVINSSIDNEIESDSNGSNDKIVNTEKDTNKNADELSEKKMKSKKSKPKKEWKEEKTFTTRKAAIQYINNEMTWSKSYSHEVRKGAKQYYRCNQVLVRGEQCAAQIFLLQERNTKKFRIFRSFDGHNCKEITNERKYQKFKNRNLSNEIKFKIQKLFEQELAPIVIYESLKTQHDVNIRQISNYLVTLRSKFGTKNPQLRSEITTWLNSINIDSKIPKNITKAFIVAHTDNQTEFRLFISSKCLLYNALNVENLHGLGTKKLSWKAYFLHIVGTIDCNDKFHPYGIGVCPSNQIEDFQFILESLRDGCLKLFNTVPKHKILIRDSCYALELAFQKFYDKNLKSKICWEYARRKMKRKLDEFLPKDDLTKKKLMLDLDTVQLSENASEFHVRINQFMDKWSMCVKFCTYLFQEWVDCDNKNWYNIPINTVCNNNALRLFINDLENDETFRGRLPVEQFREKMFEWIENWSNNEPSIDLSCFVQIVEDETVDIKNDSLLRQNLNEDEAFTKEYLEDKSDLSLKELEAIVERKREKKFGKQWKIEKIFQSKSEAEEAIANEGYWGSMFKNKTKAGLKVFYRCKKVISRGKQCEAALSLLFKSDSTDVILMRSGLDHTCHQIGLKQKGIDANVKLKVEELFELNYKPKNILDYLKENNIGPLPTLMQLNNYLNVIREGKYGSKSVDFNQIRSWLSEASNLPNQLTKMFVSAYEIENSKFRFFLTSKKLLQNGLHLNHLQIDSINKIEWVKYPIYILGFTNHLSKFQILGFFVCYSNKIEDFTFIFKSLKNSIAKIFNIIIQPSVLITDTCKNIEDAFLTVFDINLKIKICSSFVRRDLKKKAIEFIGTKEIVTAILNDLNLIQKSTNDDAFQLNLNNFVEKYNEVGPEFVEYFQQEFMIYNNCWYDNYEPHVPKNNNAIEQIVKTLKNEDKQRKKISLLQLEKKLSKWIEVWSNESNLLQPATIST